MSFELHAMNIISHCEKLGYEHLAAYVAKLDRVMRELVRKQRPQRENIHAQGVKNALARKRARTAEKHALLVSLTCKTCVIEKPATAFYAGHRRCKDCCKIARNATR